MTGAWRTKVASSSLSIWACTERCAANRSASSALYREHIGGAWSGYLDALYTHGKRRWGYAIPDAPADRQLLRHLCAQTLDFERHFFAHYRDHLLARLDSGDPALQLVAAERLGEIIYPGDTAVTDVLQALAASPDESLSAAAKTALRLAES